MRRKILIVDDNEVNRRILSKITSEEYDSIEAVNGKDAIEILNLRKNEISAVLLDIVMPVADGYEVLKQIRNGDNGFRMPVIVVTGCSQPDAEVKALSLGANDYIVKPYNPTVIRHRIRNAINLMEADAAVDSVARDRLTGLYNREAFFVKAAEMIFSKEPGYYVLSSMDIDNFKVINDQYGSAKGDEVLRHVGKVFLEGFKPLGGISCRITADSFAVLYPSSKMDTPEVMEICRAATSPDGQMLPMTISTGRYLVKDVNLPISAMYDRAVIAETHVKGRFDVHIAQYDETMREQILREQEIINEMNMALTSGQFEVWFQPQFNHSSGAIIGSEALVRWRHPKKGMISPAEFIHVFERNGFIYELDKYVWEQVCLLLRKWLDEGRKPLPISMNVSRYDVFREDFLTVINGLLTKYDIPVDLLCLEITESAFAKSTKQIVGVVMQLVDMGITVEIDDFGSGYSSFNTLKDVPAGVLKLDMRFLKGNDNSQRGGNILESIVRMTKWLGISVIAEGVETREQADFLRSIGCCYVQGYLYAKPMTVGEYEILASDIGKEEKRTVLETVETLDNNAFWDPMSMETLIFNSYVGGACIFEYHNDETELLRVNEKYAIELGVSVEEALKLDINNYMDYKSVKLMKNNIDCAAKTSTEATCEVCLSDLPNRKGKTYLRFTTRVLARAGDRLLFYNSIFNITAQREAEKKQSESAEQLQAIINNVNGGVTASTIVDGKVKYLFINECYYSMLGYTQQQFHNELPNGLADIIEPEDLQVFFEMVERQEKNGDLSAIELRVRKRDKSVIWLRINSAVCRIEGEEAPVHISVTTDITQEKEYEQRIVDGKNQLRFLNDTAHDLLAQTETEDSIEDVLRKTLEYFEGNRAYIFEFDHEAKSASNTYEICADGVKSEKDNLQNIPFEAVQTWVDALSERNNMCIENVNELDESRIVERRLLEAQNIESLVCVPFHRNGKLIGLIGVDDPHRHKSHIDNLEAIGDYLAVIITRRDLNAKLENENQTLLSLMNDTPGGFCRMKKVGEGVFVPIYVNEAFCRLVGMTSDEIIEKSKDTPMWGVYPEDIGIVEAAINIMCTTGEVRNVKYRLLHGNGGYVWIVIFGRMTKGINGDVFLNIYFDTLSGHEKNEIFVRSMLPIALEAMMALSTDLFFVKDVNLQYLCCSRTFANMVGLENEKAIRGKSDFDLFNYELAKKYRSDDFELLQSRQSIIDREELLPSNDGKMHYSNTSKYLLYDSQGNVIGLYGIGRDITDSRTAYSQLKLLTDGIPGGIASYEITSCGMRTLYFSDGVYRLSGYSREEFDELSNDNPLFYIIDEDQHMLLDGVAEFIKSDVPIECICRLRMKNGSLRWLNFKGTAGEKNGEAVILNVVILDVTNRKLAEEAAIIHAEEMRLAMTLTGKTICEYDIEQDILIFPEAYSERYGVRRIVHNIRGTTDAVADSDRSVCERYSEFCMAIVRGASSGSREYKIRDEDDSIRWEHVEFLTVFNPQGNPIKAIFALEDTTIKHKKDEATLAMRENERVLQMVTAHSNRLVYRYDIMTRTISYEPKTFARQMLQQDIPEIKLENTMPESYDDFKRVFNEINQGNCEGGTKLHIVSPSGKPRWVDLRYSLIFSRNRVPKSAVISILDITENHEKELAYERYLQLIEMNANPEGGLIYFEADVTSDVTEKQGGAMLPEEFPVTVRNRTSIIDYISRKYVVEEEREKCCVFFSREHLITLFSDGMRSLVEDWSIMKNDGQPGFIRSELQMVQDPYSGHIKAYTILRDITDEKLAAIDVKKQAETDGMTGLYNKATTEALVRCRLARNDGSPCTLMIADLDNLKSINDNLGHPCGDKAIFLLAQTLKTQFRSSDIVGRIGGDEFIVFLDGISDKEKLTEIMTALIERLSTIRIGDTNKTSIYASIGIAVGAVGEYDFDEFYGRADKALYHVKRNGKKQFAFFSDKT